MKKAVLITGAGSGIGEAAALEFSKAGYFIYLLGRNKEKLEQVALHCRSGARRYGCDLTETSQIDKVSDDILKQKDTRLEILVNNAGIFTPGGLLEQNLDVWRAQFETNFFGSVALTQKIYPYFKAHGGGSIVNIASTLGLKPAPQFAAYSVSKAAMISWTQALAQQGGPDLIRANVICPGLVDTPIHSFHNLAPAEKKQTLQQMAHSQPLGRIGTSQEVAKAIVFIGSSESAWTTGSVLSVDGGINLL